MTLEELVNSLKKFPSEDPVKFYCPKEQQYYYVAELPRDQYCNLLLLEYIPVNQLNIKI